MHTFKWRHLLVSLFFVTSCTSESLILENFDHDIWKKDVKACRNERQRYVDTLVSQKEKLLGLNEIEVVGTLGKPDQQEIYKRHEKFYYYFLDPSPECENAPENPSRRLIIRFNAVGLSKEINVE